MSDYFESITAQTAHVVTYLTHFVREEECLLCQYYCEGLPSGVQKTRVDACVYLFVRLRAGVRLHVYPD